MTTAALLSYAALGNVLSAALTGPLLAWRGVRPKRVRIAQAVGWVLLLGTQTATLAVGVIAELPGFQYAPWGMVGIAAVNLYICRRPAKVHAVKIIAVDPAPGGFSVTAELEEVSRG